MEEVQLRNKAGRIQTFRPMEVAESRQPRWGYRNRHGEARIPDSWHARQCNVDVRLSCIRVGLHRRTMAVPVPLYKPEPQEPLGHIDNHCNLALVRPIIPTQAAVGPAIVQRVPKLGKLACHRPGFLRPMASPPSSPLREVPSSGVLSSMQRQTF